MPVPFFADLRRRVLDAAGSASASTVAVRFGVSTSTVHRLYHLDRQTGSVAPKSHGGGHTRLISDDDRAHFDGHLA